MEKGAPDISCIQKRSLISRCQTKHHGKRAPRSLQKPLTPNAGPCRRAVDAPSTPPAPAALLLWGLQHFSISLFPLFFHQKLGKPPSHPRRSGRKQ